MSIYTEIKCIGGRVNYPFSDRGDNVTREYELDCICDADAYAPSNYNDTLQSAATAGVDVLPAGFADVAAFWVEDSNPAPHSGPLVKFTRTFSHVPAAAVEPNGIYAFEFPVVPGGVFVSKNSTAESSSYNTSALTVTITATLSAGDVGNFRSGDVVSIVNPNRWAYEIAGGWQYQLSSFTGPCTVSGNVVTLVQDFYYIDGTDGTRKAYDNFSDQSAAHYSVKKMRSPERAEPETVNSPSKVSLRYVKVDDVSGLALADRFYLTDTAGAPITATTTTSLPYTTAAWQSAALFGEYIAAEDETFKRWRGNIYELSQIKVRMK